LKTLIFELLGLLLHRAVVSKCKVDFFILTSTSTTRYRIQL
jgi:hypothetical protein